MFTKHFNSSHQESINQQRDVLYVSRFLGQLLQRLNDFLQHIRTYVLFQVIAYLVNVPFDLFAFLSLIGSTTLSMTYGINVRPYNDPFVVIAEEAVDAAAELLNAGAFLVDIIPILKYVPDWFPGAKFQKTAAMLRTHSGKIRNATFAATKNLMVCIPRLFTGLFSNYLMTPSQANGEYDPSFVSEALRQIEQHDDLNQNVDLLKDVAAQAYVGEFRTFYMFVILFSANGALLQQEQIAQLQLLGHSSWQWSAIRRSRRRLKKNSTESSMEGFLNIAILCRFHTSRRLLRKFIGTVKFASRILRFTLNMFPFVPDGSLYFL